MTFGGRNYIHKLWPNEKGKKIHRIHAWIVIGDKIIETVKDLDDPPLRYYSVISVEYGARDKEVRLPLYKEKKSSREKLVDFASRLPTGERYEFSEEVLELFEAT